MVIFGGGEENELVERNKKSNIHLYLYRQNKIHIIILVLDLYGVIFGGGEKDECSTNFIAQSSSLKSYPHAIHKPSHFMSFHQNRFHKYLSCEINIFFLCVKYLLLLFITILMLENEYI